MEPPFKPWEIGPEGLTNLPAPFLVQGSGMPYILQTWHEDDGKLHGIIWVKMP